MIADIPWSDFRDDDGPRPPPGAELVTAIGLVSLTGPLPSSRPARLRRKRDEWLDYGSAQLHALSTYLGLNRNDDHG